MTTDDLIAVDTNILIYAEAISADPSDARCIAATTWLPPLLATGRIVIPAQVLGEFIAVLERKTRLARSVAIETAAQWRQFGRLAPTDAATLDSAMILAARHGLTIWDSIVLAAAAEAGCALLLTEDLHDGFVWRGCTVANPFAPVRHPLFASLLP